jgi:hypothetical protein
MVRRNGEYKTELRAEMRGGKGTVKIEEFWAPKTEMRSNKPHVLAPDAESGLFDRISSARRG